MNKLLTIQIQLKAPKNQYSKFGDFNYRSCEDILEALKPLLLEHKATLILTDEIITIGDRFYVKSTARFIDPESGEKIETIGYAREPLSKTKMDEPQLTGTASSYARKYALNGLFLIDDNKDADTDEYKKISNNSSNKQVQQKPKVDPIKYYIDLVAKAGITGEDADNLIHKYEKEMNNDQRKEECKRLLTIVKNKA